MQHTKKLIPQPLPYPTNPSNSIKNSAKIQSPTNHTHPQQPIPPNSPCPHWSNYPPSAAPMKLVFLGATLHGENYLRPPWANQGRGCPVGWRNDWMALFLFWRGNSQKKGRVYTLTNTSVWHYMLLEVHRRFPLDTNGRENLKKKTC